MGGDPEEPDAEIIERAQYEESCVSLKENNKNVTARFDQEDRSELSHFLLLFFYPM